MIRKTIGGSSNPSVTGAAKARNNGRYNGNGREWETPPEVFGPLHAEFGFTVDVCAKWATRKVDRYFDEMVADGLKQPWSVERCWMNPPYGREIYAWTRKARLEVASRCPLVVGLLPASTDLSWWHEDVIGCCKPGDRTSLCRGLARGKAALTEIRYIGGRVRFLTGGPYKASAFQPSVIVIWRAK